MTRPYAAISEEERQFVEVWENVAQAQNWIVRLDPRGDEKHELAPPGREFQVTTQERLIVQSKVADPKDDPFLNGSFRPVHVPDSVTVETNPNALSDDDIMKVFDASDVAWEEYLKVIDSPATLERMVELSEASSLSVARLRQLEGRLKAVRPARRVTQRDREQFEKIDEPAPARSRRTSPATVTRGAATR